MSLAIKHLAAGVLSDAQTTLYQVPAGKAALLRMIMVNRDSVNRLVNIWFRPAGGSLRLITPFNLDLPTRYKVELDVPFSMGAGDSIIGNANGSDVVDYIINGALEDLIATL